MNSFAKGSLVFSSTYPTHVTYDLHVCWNYGSTTL